MEILVPHEKPSPFILAIKTKTRLRSEIDERSGIRPDWSTSLTIKA